MTRKPRAMRSASPSSSAVNRSSCGSCHSANRPAIMTFVDRTRRGNVNTHCIAHLLQLLYTDGPTWQPAQLLQASLTAISTPNLSRIAQFSVSILAEIQKIHSCTRDRDNRYKPSNFYEHRQDRLRSKAAHISNYFCDDTEDNCKKR